MLACQNESPSLINKGEVFIRNCEVELRQEFSDAIKGLTDIDAILAIFATSKVYYFMRMTNSHLWDGDKDALENYMTNFLQYILDENCGYKFIWDQVNKGAEVIHGFIKSPTPDGVGYEYLKPADTI